MVVIASASVNIPSCGGIECCELKLKPGTARIDELFTTCNNPSGLYRVLWIFASGKFSVLLNLLYGETTIEIGLSRKKIVKDNANVK
jgi:hypothetical protein